MGRVTVVTFGSQAPDPEVFLERLLESWVRAQTSSDRSKQTVRAKRARVLDLVEFSGHYPWEWSVADADDYFSHCRGVRNLAHNTVRNYQGAIRSFCEFACDPRYDWNTDCARLFGAVFSQIVTEWNRIPHSQPNASKPEKRVFTQWELQQLFDLADLEPERKLASGRKGALSAMRDAALFKTLYGWGLRIDEGRHLQRVDLSENAGAPQFGEYGVVRVRWGKSHRGSAKKTRSVLTVWEWTASALQNWVEFALPLYGKPLTDLFPTTGGRVVAESHALRRLRGYLDELGFAPGVDLHAFRRSYSAHLITGLGADVSFVQQQLGHAHASTTSIYTLASPDYQRESLKRLHEKTLAAAMTSRKGSTR
ncbi:tyrosine-type recombinase/integrase [Leifsonia shinshuensis]|uniref:Tyrosine-type recombinase/integrase n=2 Tax=Leifsonia shinshuensis TaxID=150026 RepID=A0A7G6YGA5_9MICO|nr:tyrosine-type recombinase/integrase [Leifsonia shinshuensis]